jgi:hypothetical protein
MSAIKVFKEKDELGEWVFWCSEHHVETVAPDWDLAYEAAAGHAVMQHPSKPATLLARLQQIYYGPR